MKRSMSGARRAVADGVAQLVLRVVRDLGVDARLVAAVLLLDRAEHVVHRLADVVPVRDAVAEARRARSSTGAEALAHREAAADPERRHGSRRRSRSSGRAACRRSRRRPRRARGSPTPPCRSRSSFMWLLLMPFGQPGGARGVDDHRAASWGRRRPPARRATRRRARPRSRQRAVQVGGRRTALVLGAQRPGCSRAPRA